MKPIVPILLLTFAVPAFSQRPTASKPAADCVKTPELSPKIPALPAGTCPRSLFRITVTPGARLDYVSPLVTPEVRESLGLDPVTFSLDYVDIQPGTGPLALPKKFYTLQYTGYLTDGTKFDSSLDRGPFTFPIGQHRVIAGWDLGFQGMHVGGKRRLYIPYQLGYADKAQPSIPAKSELIFDIELISQSDEEPKPPSPLVPPAPAAAAPQAGQPARPATPPPAQH